MAWHPLGWEPLAFSEIEPFPRAVLQHNYPDVPLHGDFTKLRDEDWIVDADILVGGTPCQAFSVAGLRNSLSDERGNLSLEFVRLADAIDAVRFGAGREPCVIVWENVPGVLSVSDNAFGCFLAALAGDAAPYDPPRGKWTNAGVVDGPQRTVAWRILDAQYFGRAQRRRRVFVVASARDGFDPAAVLLEFEGVRRDTSPRREAGKGASQGAEGRAGERSHWDGDFPHPTLNQSDQANAETLIDQAGTLNCNKGQQGGILFDVTHSLRAEGFDASEDGTGRGTPLVPVTVGALTSGHGGSAGHQYRMKGNEQALVPVAFSYKDSGADAANDLSPTLRALGAYDANGGGQMAVAVALRGRDGGGTAELGGDIQNALRASQGGGDKPHVLAFHENQRAEITLNDTAGSLKVGGGKPGQGYPAVMASMAVRRLTPVECERLQGFPDGYTHIPWRNKPEAPDGPRYKALGNSMAVPCMRWIGRRIKERLT